MADIRTEIHKKPNRCYRPYTAEFKTSSTYSSAHALSANSWEEADLQVAQGIELFLAFGGGGPTAYTGHQVAMKDAAAALDQDCSLFRYSLKWLYAGAPDLTDVLRPILAKMFFKDHAEAEGGAPAWVANTAYALGDYVKGSNNVTYVATNAGTSSSVAPGWPFTANATIVDNAGSGHSGTPITWRNTVSMISDGGNFGLLQPWMEETFAYASPNFGAAVLDSSGYDGCIADIAGPAVTGAGYLAPNPYDPLARVVRTLDRLQWSKWARDFLMRLNTNLGWLDSAGAAVAFSAVAARHKRLMGANCLSDGKAYWAEDASGNPDGTNAPTRDYVGVLDLPWMEQFVLAHNQNFATWATQTTIERSADAIIDLESVWRKPYCLESAFWPGTVGDNTLANRKQKCRYSMGVVLIGSDGGGFHQFRADNPNAAYVEGDPYSGKHRQFIVATQARHGEYPFDPTPIMHSLGLPLDFWRDPNPGGTHHVSTTGCRRTTAGGTPFLHRRFVGGAVAVNHTAAAAVNATIPNLTAGATYQDRDGTNYVASGGGTVTIPSLPPHDAALLVKQ